MKSTRNSKTGYKKSARLYFSLYNKNEVVPEELLSTHITEKQGKITKHYINLDGIKTEVFTSSEVNKHRLFLDDTQIQDVNILMTHITETIHGYSKHYVWIDGIKTEVFTAGQVFHNRLYYHGEQIKDKHILKTHAVENVNGNRKHYLVIDGNKVEVQTKNQMSSQRLFLEGKNITNKEILKTHTVEGKGRLLTHYVMIRGKKTEVKTANQVSNQRLFIDGKQIKDKEILKTHIIEGVGRNSTHYVMINGIKKRVMTAKQQSIKNKSKMKDNHDPASFDEEEMLPSLTGEEIEILKKHFNYPLSNDQSDEGEFTINATEFPLLGSEFAVENFNEINVERSELFNTNEQILEEDLNLNISSIPLLSIDPEKIDNIECFFNHALPAVPRVAKNRYALFSEANHNKRKEEEVQEKPTAKYQKCKN